MTRAEQVKPTPLYYGPKYKSLSGDIQKTKSAFDGVIADMLEKLSLLSTSLMSGAIGFDPNDKNHDAIVKKTTDRQ